MSEQLNEITYVVHLDYCASLTLEINTMGQNLSRYKVISFFCGVTNYFSSQFCNHVPSRDFIMPKLPNNIS